MANSATLLAKFSEPGGPKGDSFTIYGLCLFPEGVPSVECSQKKGNKMSSPRTGRLVIASPDLDNIYFSGFSSDDIAETV